MRHATFKNGVYFVGLQVALHAKSMGIGCGSGTLASSFAVCTQVIWNYCLRYLNIGLFTKLQSWQPFQNKKKTQKKKKERNEKW